MPVENKTCFCNKNIIEDEQHFLTTCPKYHSLRNELYEKIDKSVIDFKLLTPEKIYLYDAMSESVDN